MTILIIAIYIFIDSNTKSLGNGDFKKEIKINIGEGYKSIATKLEDEKIIKSKDFFYYYTKYYLLKFKLPELKIKHGVHQFDDGMSIEEILYELDKPGRAETFKITIIEGMNIYNIAKVFAEKEICSELEFLQLVHSKSLLDKYGISYEGIDTYASLEGYLYPQTYYIPYEYSAEQVIDVMVEELFENFPREKYEKQAKEVGLSSYHDLLTLASIIEKETNLSTERPKVAAVYYNRLLKGIQGRTQLDSCPSVIYALWLEGHEDPQLNELEGKMKDKTKSPFNTYRYGGLPPGPIANPGAESIIAALNPDPNYTESLFFVAKFDGSGSHYFANTYEQHLTNIQRARRNQRRYQQ